MVTLFALKVNCFFPIQKLLRVFILHFQSGRKRPRETVSAEVVAVDVTPDSNGTRPHAGNSRATGFPGGASNGISNGYTLSVNGVALLFGHRKNGKPQRDDPCGFCADDSAILVGVAGLKPAA